MRFGRLCVFVFALCALAIGTAGAVNVGPPRAVPHVRTVGPLVHWTDQMLQRSSASAVEVKFREGSDLRLGAEGFTAANGGDVAMVRDALAHEEILEVRPTFSLDRAVLRSWKAAGEARSGVAGPDLSLWFDIRIGGGREAVARLVNALNALPMVEIAHPSPEVEPAVVLGAQTLDKDVGATTALPVTPSPATPDFSFLQGYLYAPPRGLNATAAWQQPSGLGQGTHFVDVELAWTVDHEDFDVAGNFYVGGAAQNMEWEPHGTAVLGEVIGRHNSYGIKGFAPAASYGVVAITAEEWPVVPQYFQEAVNQLAPGEVWLIELQMSGPGMYPVPMEYLQVNYDVIWTSVWSLGILCVEAGANGGLDLDAPVFAGMFDRNVRDSGAIMVGAGTPDDLIATSFSNYGTRMDVHAWGERIVTTGYGDLYNGGTLQTRYAADFGGTSGASPMVVGCALCLQSIAATAIGHMLDPIQMRTLLHNTGTPQNGTRLIGPRPDLRRAIDALLPYSGVPASEPAPEVRVFPNPFREYAGIHYSLPRSGAVRLQIFDASGRLVRTLLDGPAGSGAGFARWDGRTEGGRDVPSGMYFYRIDAAGGATKGAIEKVR